MVALLLDKGAKINAASDRRRTPTDIAVQYHKQSPKKGYGPIVEFLRLSGGKTKYELHKQPTGK